VQVGMEGEIPQVTPMQWAMIAGGAFAAFTAVGYIRDTFWDPSAARRNRFQARLGRTPKRRRVGPLPDERAGRSGEENIKVLMGMVDQLEKAKQYVRAEEVVLRLLTLIEEDTSVPPDQIGSITIYFLMMLLKFTKAQEKFEEVEGVLLELLMFEEEMPPADFLEWQVSLLENYRIRNMLKQALHEGFEANKTYLKIIPTAKAEEKSRISLTVFLLREKMGDVYRQMGNMREAEIWYRLALTDTPRQYLARANSLAMSIASLCLEQDRDDDLEDFFHSFFGSQATLADRRRQLLMKGKVYTEGRRLEKAAEMYRTTIESLPPAGDKLIDREEKSDLEQAMMYLANVLVEQGNLKEARELFDMIGLQDGVYALACSRYFLTKSMTFNPSGEDFLDIPCKGKWTISLTRRNVPENLRPLAVGDVVEVISERTQVLGIEEVADDDDDVMGLGDVKGKNEAAERNMDVTKVTVTKDMLEDDTIEFTTSATIAPAKNKKCLLQLNVYKNGEEKVESSHIQFACRLEKKSPAKATEDMRRLLQQMQMDMN